MDLGKLTASLSLNIGQFVTNIGQAVRHVQGLGSALNGAAGSGASGGINTTARSVDALSGSFKDLDRIVSGIMISQIFYQTVHAIGEGISSIMHFSNEMAKAQISFEYFLGSSDKAKGFVENMKDFAATTSFSTEQAMTLSRKLMGAQFKPENVRGIMETLNDASAATGGTPEQIDRIVLALTQVKTAGKLMGGEMRQFAEAGVPIYQIVREELGLTGDQIRNVGKMAIDGDKAIAGILSGLEKRYKGAAKRMAETIPGLWQTIQDDSLMVGSKMFEGPYAGIQTFLKGLRDAMETARSIVTQSGLGGLFNHFIPPELQTAVRNIIGSFQSLGGSIRILWGALQPVMAMLGGALIQALGVVMPIIAGVVRVISGLISAIMNANPWIQALAAAIMGLMIANVAAKAMMFLWTVTGMGMISGAVAQAVMILSRAIQGLFFVMMRNPLIGILVALAAALLYVSGASAHLSGMLDGVMGRIGQLAGVDFTKIMQPEQGKSLTEWTGAFNKQLEGMGSNLTDTGQKAQKAGKKVKETFVASFDELYQIPDKLNQTKDALGGVGDAVGNLPGIPDFKLPNMDIPSAKIPDFHMPDLSVPPIIGRVGGGGGGGPEGGGKIPPPDASPVTEMLATVNSLIADFKAKLQADFEGVTVWANNLIKVLGTVPAPIAGIILALELATSAVGALRTAFDAWSVGAKAAVTEWASSTQASFGGWVSTTGKLLEEWGNGVKAGFNNWVLETQAAFANWRINVAYEFTLWVNTTYQTVSAWNVNTLAAINSFITSSQLAVSAWSAAVLLALALWSANAWTTISTWSANAYATVATWSANTLASFETWATLTWQRMVTWTMDTVVTFNNWAMNTGLAFGGWIINTQLAFANWTLQVATSFNTWGINTEAAFSAWVTNTGNNIDAWVTTTKQNFEQWATDTYTPIKTWVSTTAKNFRDWADNVGQNIVAWGNGTLADISAWAQSTDDAFVTWINGTAAGFAAWVNNVAANIGAFVSNSGESIHAWASSTWEAFNSWLAGTSSGVGAWAKNTLSTITSWAQSAWATINGLAAAAGQSVGTSLNIAGDNIASTASGIGAWAGKNRSWLIPVVVGAAVVGGTMAAVASGGLALPALAPLLALETGGIVDKDQLVRIGEGNKREAVIPLQNSAYMKPFSAAVASDLADMFGNSRNDLSSGNAGADTRPILYVGTLIADERSLKELYRKMEVIGIAENQRKGLS